MGLALGLGIGWRMGALTSCLLARSLGYQVQVLKYKGQT